MREDAPHLGGVLLRAAPFELRQARPREPEILGVERARAHLARAHLAVAGGAGGGDLVEAVFPVHHQRMLGAQVAQHLRDGLDQVRRVDPHQLAPRPGWVGERPQDVEHRAQAELSAHRHDLAHRRMEDGAEQEGDAHLVEGAAGGRRVGLDAHAERGEHVGAA